MLLLYLKYLMWSPTKSYICQIKLYPASNYHDVSKTKLIILVLECNEISLTWQKILWKLEKQYFRFKEVTMEIKVLWNWASNITLFRFSILINIKHINHTRKY